MPYLLDTPEQIQITGYQITAIAIDLEANSFLITMAALDGSTEISRESYSLPIMDDFGALLLPSNWPEGYPTAEVLYGYMKNLFYLLLQDTPGALGAGVIS